jgi:anti-anti-sigma factor
MENEKIEKPEKLNDIFIAADNDNIIIKPIGHITANKCFTLREYFYKDMGDVQSDLSIFMDLSEIRHMDSTFLGILIGIEKRLIKHLKKHLIIINSNETAMELLKSMGLDLYLNLKTMPLPENLAFDKFETIEDISDIDKLKTILSSHKNLGEVNKKNKEKFKQVQNIVKKELKSKTKKNGS